MHSDVCQLSHTARDGSKYFVTFVDDYSKFSSVYFTTVKSQVFKCIQHFIRSTVRETGEKLMELRSDNGGEYIPPVTIVYIYQLACSKGGFIPGG